MRCSLALVLACAACGGKKESPPPAPPANPNGELPPLAPAHAEVDAPPAPPLPNAFAEIDHDAALAFDADNIYVVSTKLDKIAKADGKRTTLIDDLGKVRFDRVVVAGKHVIACQTDGLGCVRVAITGGAVQKFGKGARIDHIKADDYALYVELDTKALERLEFDDQKSITLVPAPNGETYRILISLDDGLLFADTIVASPGSVTRLVRASMTEPAAQDLGTLSTRPIEIARDGQTLYILGHKQIDKDTIRGASNKLADWDLASGATMRMDGKNLYFGISNAQSAMFRLAKTGGTVDKLRDLPAYTQLVDVDAKTLWVRSATALYALPKP